MMTQIEEQGRTNSIFQVKSHTLRERKTELKRKIKFLNSHFTRKRSLNLSA